MRYPPPLGMRKRRIELGMTLAKLAEECTRRGVNVSLQTVGKIESGKHRPRPALRKTLADVLGYTAEEFPIPPGYAGGGGRKPDPSPVSAEWLGERYLVKKWNVAQIAKEIGKSYGYTRALLHASGIPLRRKGNSPGRPRSNVIRSARLDKGMNQATLAQMCGVAPSTICRIEQGIHAPNSALRATLAQHLDIPIQEIPLSGREMPIDDA